MKNTDTNIRNYILSGFALLILSTISFANPVVRQATGNTPAGIQGAVDQFRADLGANNGVGGSFAGGRREINWDGVPDNLSAPNFMPNDFFNVNSPRGVVFSSNSGNSSLLASGQQAFQVSADDSNPTSTPPRFSNIDPSYGANFQPFSTQRLFTIFDSNVMEITFFIPGTTIPATVNGFGAVFTDVDVNSTRILLFDAKGKRLPGPNFVPIPDSTTNNLSFQGISFDSGERIARVVIIAGNAELKFQNVDSNNSVRDVVAMDDFIYGEPHAAEHHKSDFDGDGTTDLSVYRPATGQWFVFNSGSNTFNVVQFGLDGDVPVDGDFDGDGKNDVTVYRPSNGTWFVLNSSNGQAQTVQFGLNGDKPVAGDYDKDGKTDIAVWRPSDGNYYILRSSNGQAQITHWGANGDIPIGAAQ